MSKIFGKKQTPEELCKKWRLELRKQTRELDRSIREITTAENKLKMDIRKYAKAGDTVNAKTLARELVTSRKAKERLYTQKAQLNSVSLQLQQQSCKLINSDKYITSFIFNFLSFFLIFILDINLLSFYLFIFLLNSYLIITSKLCLLVFLLGIILPNFSNIWKSFTFSGYIYNF